MKLSFGIIVLNGDFFLKQVLESIYPVAHSICIAEGAVKWWADKGVSGSTDDTIEIIKSFPDPQSKIKWTSGVYAEKTEQCQAWFNMIPDDTDYVICNDADEIHTPENIEKLIKYLEKEQPTSVGFKSDSFFGGFDRIIGGFERDHSFKRVLKYIKGSHYRTHRQPTLSLNGKDIWGRDLTGNHLYESTGVTMWHGSYVSPKQVREKLDYYEGSIIKKGQCIPNYYTDVFLNWVRFPESRPDIEKKWKGVQEFVPEARGECYTIPFTGEHPEVIKRDMDLLLEKFNEQLK